MQIVNKTNKLVCDILVSRVYSQWEQVYRNKVLDVQNCETAQQQISRKENEKCVYLYHTARKHNVYIK